MKSFLLSALISLVCSSIYCQITTPCSSFNCTINRAQSFITSKQYSKAFESLQSAEGYPDENGKNKKTINRYRKQLFDAIENDRLQAERNELKARREKERADSLAQVAIVEKQKAIKALELAQKMEQTANVAEEQKEILEANRLQLIEIDDLQQLGLHAKKKGEYSEAIQKFEEALTQIKTLNLKSESPKQKILNFEIAETKDLLASKEKFNKYIEDGDDFFNEGLLSYNNAYQSYFNALDMGYNNEKAKSKIKVVNERIGWNLKSNKKLFGDKYFDLVVKNARSNLLFYDRVQAEKNLFRALNLKPNKEQLNSLSKTYPELKQSVEKHQKKSARKLVFSAGIRAYFPVNSKNKLKIIKPSRIEETFTYPIINSLQYYNFGITTSNSNLLQFSYRFFNFGTEGKNTRSYIGFNSESYGFLIKHTVFKKYHKRKKIERFVSRVVLGGFRTKYNSGINLSIANNTARELPLDWDSQINLNWLPFEVGGFYDFEVVTGEETLVSKVFSCTDQTYFQNNGDNSYNLDLGIDLTLRPFPKTIKLFKISAEIGYTFEQKSDKIRTINLGEQISDFLISSNELSEENTNELRAYYHENCNYSLTISDGNDLVKIFYSGLYVSSGISISF